MGYSLKGAAEDYLVNSFGDTVLDLLPGGLALLLGVLDVVAAGVDCLLSILLGALRSVLCRPSALPGLFCDLQSASSCQMYRPGASGLIKNDMLPYTAQSASASMPKHRCI